MRGRKHTWVDVTVRRPWPPVFAPWLHPWSEAISQGHQLLAKLHHDPLGQSLRSIGLCSVGHPDLAFNSNEAPRDDLLLSVFLLGMLGSRFTCEMQEVRFVCGCMQRAC